MLARAYAACTAIAVAGILHAGVGPTHAQQWAPDRQVKVVIPFPAGGAADATARVLTQEITRASGQGFVMESRPGGGTVIATELVARAPADGTTLLLMANSFVINPGLKASLPYDPLGFEPICMLAYSPLVLAVNNASPFKTIAELVTAAKAKPPELTIAAVGPATAHHIALEMLKRSAGIDFSYVPFPGGAPSVTTLVGNHVSATLANFNEMQSNLGPNLRPLAVGANSRLAELPDVPTFAEAGYADVIVTAWFGIVAPPKTPPATVAAMTGAFKAALAVPAVPERLKTIGLVAFPACGSDMATFIRDQIRRYGTAIKEAGLKGD